MKLQDIKHVFTDDLLGLIGLEVKQPHRANWYGVAGSLVVGMLIGASAVLLLTPKATKELTATKEPKEVKERRSRRSSRRLITMMPRRCLGTTRLTKGQA